MGGQRYSERVLEWAQVYGETFTTSQAMHALGLDGKQAQNALRRFANEGKLEQLGTRVWCVNRTQISSNGDTIDSPARRVRESGRAARDELREHTYAHIDNFEGGAILLRSDAGKFFRAELTEL